MQVNPGLEIIKFWKRSTPKFNYFFVVRIIHTIRLQICELFGLACIFA